MHVHTRLFSPEQHDREEARGCENVSGPAQGSERAERRGHHWERLVNTSAYRERGKAKLSSIEEVWEEMLLIPPPDLVPLWDQMQDSGDCCGFMVTA